MSSKAPLIDDNDKGLRFFKDWTVEHIYPRNPPPADVALTPNEHKWFNDAKFKRLHCLGNLLPLNGSLNSQAKDHAFILKRGIYEKGNNSLVRAASRLDGYERDARLPDAAEEFAREVTFLPKRFVQRHRLLKDLLVKHVFGCKLGPEGDFYVLPQQTREKSEAVPSAAAPLAVVAPTSAGRPSEVSPGHAYPHRTNQGIIDRFLPGLPTVQASLPGAAAVSRGSFPLPSHFSGHAKTYEVAYDWALGKLPSHVDRNRLRLAIDRLIEKSRGRSYSVVRSEAHYRRFHELANSAYRNPSSYVIKTRRVDIVGRVFDGAITIEDVEGAAGDEAAAGEGTGAGAGEGAGVGSKRRRDGDGDREGVECGDREGVE